MPNHVRPSDPTLEIGAVLPPTGSSAGPTPLRDVSLHDQARIEKLTVIGQARDVVIHGRRELSWPQRIGVVPPVLWRPDAHPLLFRSGRSRGDGGLFNQAIEPMAGCDSRGGCL